MWADAKSERKGGEEERKERINELRKQNVGIKKEKKHKAITFRVNSNWRGN
jgi:hypothetical protein